LKKFSFYFLFLTICSIKIYGQQFTISGYIADSTNGESAIGALAFIKGTTQGTSTNVYGFYSLSLPAGEYEICFNYLGFEPIIKKIKLDKNIVINPKLSPVKNELTEVVITADEQLQQVKSTQMGVIRIPIEQIKNIPTIGGETDIIKVMQLMPGVKRGGEGQNGMFVRGGSGDDNLILLDEAVVYNVSHLFGFFSVFNNDALKDVTLIKGGFPSKYGGRLSSVMDIRMKDGDQEHWRVDGGIGLLSSRLTIQGPLKKDKMSFLLAGRRSYIDKVFKMAYGGKNVLPYYFYDINMKVNYKISNKDRLYFSYYDGDDILAASAPSDSGIFEGGFKLGNTTFTTRWNHIFDSRIFSNTSLVYTKFRYDVEANIPGNSFLVRSNIKDIGIKEDVEIFESPESHITCGYSFVSHGFRPNVVNTSGEISEYLRSQQGKLITTNESGIYFGHERTLDSLFKIYYGFRTSSLSGDSCHYWGFEPRFSLNYALSETQSLKFGYSRMKQYMHLVSSSSIALPTDLWYPVTKNVKPQSSDQLAVGYVQKIKKIKSLLTVEAYYKWLNNLIEYKEGAVLLLNNNYENELIRGKGAAYGLEFFLQKSTGKFTGWVGYTLSWATRKFDKLNYGEKYFAKYDKRHDLSLVGTYEFTKRFSFSAVWIFSTGQRFTALKGNFFMPNSALSNVDVLNIYSGKNAIVLPPSHRMDINFILKTKKRKYWVEGEWNFGAYNLYNRAQPYKVEIVANDNGTYKYQAKGLFGFIPSVAYNFKF